MYHGLDKNLGDDLISMDVRSGEFWYHNKYDKKHDRVTRVKPTVIADMQHIPFQDGLFSMILFDPPHADFSPTSYFYKRYGSMKDEQFNTLKINDEFLRVLKKDGILLAKIFDKRKKQLLKILPGFRPFLNISHKSKSYKSNGTVSWLLMTGDTACK